MPKKLNCCRSPRVARLTPTAKYPVRYTPLRQFVSIDGENAFEYPAVVDHDRREVRIWKGVHREFRRLLVKWAEECGRKSLASYQTEVSRG